jgi:hypothetical protein
MSKAIKGAEVFSVGTHNGLTFTESDLDAIVSSFEALNKAARVPLKFGHNDEQDMTDGKPALGWVQRVWRDGKKLFADFMDVPTVVFEAIRKGLYKQVSIELLKNYSREGSSYPWVLDAVALLGADIPAVKDLRDLQTLLMTRQLQGATFASVAAFTSDRSIHIGDHSTMTEAEEKALRDQLAASQNELKKFQESVQKEKVEAHRSTVKEVLENAVTEGRIYPRTRDRILNSRLFKDDAEVLTAYSIDSVKEEIKSDQRADFKEKPTSKKGATSMQGNSDEPDFSGRTVADVLVFKAERECVRLGFKVSDQSAMLEAVQRVMRAEPKLAKAHHADPMAIFTADAAA